MSKSVTYNQGKIVGFTYTTIIQGITQTVTKYFEVATGVSVDPNKVRLIPDRNSEDKFKAICCNILSSCEGWATEQGLCWVTEAGFGWGV